PVHELVEAERVGLDGPPGRVEAGRPVLDRTDAVLPPVAGDEVPTRVPHRRDTKLTDQLKDVASKTGLVGGGVPRLEDAPVDAPPHVLDERAEDPAVDGRDGERWVDRELSVLHLLLLCAWSIGWVIAGEWWQRPEAARLGRPGAGRRPGDPVLPSRAGSRGRPAPGRAPP